jgi:hypothetical protein
VTALGERGTEGLDVDRLTGKPGWLRGRKGDYRILFRRLDRDEDGYPGWFVAAVVNRRDLEREVRGLRGR